MGKTLETKREILNKLKEGRRTVSQLSEELGLAKSTVSQHLVELKGMGEVEEDDNRHFRKLKYYRIKGESTREAKPVFNTMWIGAIAAAAVIAALASVYALGGFTPQIGSHPQNLGSNGNYIPSITSSSSGGAYSCPLLRAYPTANYSDVGTIIGYVANASPCYITYINVSNSTISVGSGVKFMSYNGTMSVPSLNYTYVMTTSQRARLLNDTAQGYCWAYDALQAFGVNATHPAKCKANIYN